jgi:5-methyltetrahydropteroyltriglutamate--homocysteine methyltransferase
MHLCRGNYKGRWMAEGGYEPIAEKLFNEVEVDAFFLEYDSDRAGGFEPLRLMPPGKTVVLGLVSSKTPALEPIDELRRRIEDASRYVPLERLCISPQCGFASSVGGNPLTIADERAKLRRVVEVAELVWGR